MVTKTASTHPVGTYEPVARVLVGYGLNVRTAKINTLGERAEDSFVITGDALLETVYTTAAIFFIVVGAFIFSRFIVQWIASERKKTVVVPAASGESAVGRP